jgi:hypothetical protein
MHCCGPKRVLSNFFHRVGGEFAQDLAGHSMLAARQTIRGVLGAALIQIGPFLVFISLTIWLRADAQTCAAAGSRDRRSVRASGRWCNTRCVLMASVVDEDSFLCQTDFRYPRHPACAA